MSYELVFYPGWPPEPAPVEPGTPYPHYYGYDEFMNPTLLRWVDGKWIGMCWSLDSPGASPHIFWRGPTTDHFVIQHTKGPDLIAPFFHTGSLSHEAQPDLPPAL